ncbi:MAG: nitroreductase family deazaflavin-dependent oxidoreductase [Nevskia sp.]|nr:nitroreductase family deazaflavin-dependent oxidoreductase [Nevskia sp.]
MANDKTSAFWSRGQQSRDQLEALPDQVKRELQAHLELYLKDPEKAHLWDPIVIGVPGGPVKNLLLTYQGRKSGKTLHTVLQYFKSGEQVAVVASRGGTVDHPLWYLNLLEQPQCEVRIGKFSSAATARTAEGEERARWWSLITREQPEQLKYQSRTTRVIPVVILDFPK